ncbi:MAG: ABC transporter ATP-binding protein [Clostridia bacterium]|nr:ABC transporter ATP-binding protein [Clostridia bacterium]
MKPVLRYLRPYKKELIVAPTFKLVEAILELILPMIMAGLLDLADRGEATTKVIIERSLLMVGVAIVGLGTALVCQYLASRSAQAYGTDLRNAIMEKALTFDAAAYDKFGAAEIVNRLTNDTQKLQHAVAMLMRLVVRAPFLCIGASIMAAVVSPKTAIIIIVLIPVYIFLLWLVLFKSVPVQLRVQEKLDSVARLLREDLSGVRVIRAFGREKSREDQFYDACDEHRGQMEKVSFITASLNPATSLLMNVAIALIVWYGAKQVNIGGMTKGDIVAFVSYVTQMMLQMVIVARLVIMYTGAYASAKRVSAVLECEPQIVDCDDAENLDISANAPAVRFNDVCFAYPGSPELTVENISFSMNRGETVGIIGATGSGKSTLAKLLSREYDVDSGSIEVFGSDVRKLKKSELRAALGIVPQKAFLFSGTVASNMRKGNPDADDAQIEKALRAAQAYTFVDEAGGIDIPVSRGGTNFSGGQRQRLTVARALIKNAPVLILDDSSSALDAATEAELRNSIREYSDNTAVMLISQRISAVRKADRILVLSDGRVAGLGTHEELIDSCDDYRELCISQGEVQA